MIFFVKRLLFKLMELTLGLRPYFALRTRDPVFVNFELSATEQRAVQEALPAGFTLRPLRFTNRDAEPAHWVSYNFYEIRYPKKEMAQLRKVRCEINTFVSDPEGREGVFVFCGSPFVSREEQPSAIGRVADLAERLVVFLYGCGRLTRVRYELGAELRLELQEPEAALSLALPLAATAETETRLSLDYQRFNDISFFDEGRTHDLVNVDSAFGRATLQRVDLSHGGVAPVRSPFFERSPDAVFVHRGEIGYLVAAMNRTRRL